METGLYLVERYLPGATEDDAAAGAARVQVVVGQMGAEGISIRYLGGTFIPFDETCFCEFEAQTREAVEWANERANVPFARILPAVRLSAQRKRRRAR
jgi:Nickel responsive protein SCO4226-like